MSRPPQVHTPRHRRTSSSRWAGVVAAALTVTSVATVATPMAPRDVHVVHATEVALAARSTFVTAAVTAPPVSTLFDPAVTPVLAHLSTAVYRQLLLSFRDPQQQEVIGDFFHGGIAGVLKKQATSRLTSPDQTQILNDFFEGGVFQSEAHRFLQLFTDPDQHQFISDFVTGGLIQVVRNRLLDATGDPGQRAAIIAFFPDEVTDYRGGPIAVVQRRLIAAAKGNPFVIGLVNGIFENPVVVAVQHLIGGGPLIGTPLHELPPITPDAGVAPPHTATATKSPAVQEVSEAPTTSARHSAPEPDDDEPGTRTAPTADTEKKPDKNDVVETVATDVMKTGNKVEPAGTEDDTPKPNESASATPAPEADTTPAASPRDDTGSAGSADGEAGPRTS